MPSSPIKRAPVLSPGQIRHVLRVTAATSRQPERDAVVLLLGLSCGMRVSEIAQVTVSDICFPSGKMRTEVSLRAAITKGLRQRCIYLSGRKLVDAIERYLSYRVAHDLGVTLESPPQYRGLNPDLPLILSRKGYPYSLNRKLRRAESGEIVEYWAADALQTYVTKLYQDSGIKGSSHSGRRTFATRLVGNGATIEDVQIQLGHNSIDDTRCYIDVSKTRLRQAFEDVI